MHTRSKRARILMASAILCLAVLAGMGTARAGTPVFVSILPQKYFVEKIAGDLADVSVLVMPGASPHTYEPTPRQMAALAGARAYFAIGVTFEEVWLPRINGANPSLRIVHTDRGIDKLPMAAHHHDDHQEHAAAQEKDHEKHAAEHEHGHGDHATAHGHDNGIPDPHVWLSPDGARVLTENTRDGLIAMDPANEAAYRANANALLLEIDRVDDDIRALLAPLPDNRRSFMVFHPSWGYFARQYGLTQIPIEVGGREPSPRGLAEVIEQGRALGIGVIFVQPQFSEKSASVIAAELGARTAVLDPLAEDWPATMRDTARAIAGAAR